MFIGRPISVAAEPLASNSATSEARTSGGRQRKIMPMGRLMRPVEAALESERFQFHLPDLAKSKKSEL